MVFHTLDLIRLFIGYVDDISGTNSEEINYVAICGGFTHLQPYMHWTICASLRHTLWVRVPNGHSLFRFQTNKRN